MLSTLFGDRLSELILEAFVFPLSFALIYTRWFFLFLSKSHTDDGKKTNKWTRNENLASMNRFLLTRFQRLMNQQKKHTLNTLRVINKDKQTNEMLLLLTLLCISYVNKFDERKIRARINGDEKNGEQKGRHRQQFLISSVPICHDERVLDFILALPPQLKWTHVTQRIENYGKLKRYSSHTCSGIDIVRWWRQRQWRRSDEQINQNDRHHSHRWRMNQKKNLQLL